jgi:hypothetical protein
MLIGAFYLLLSVLQGLWNQEELPLLITVTSYPEKQPADNTALGRSRLKGMQHSQAAWHPFSSPEPPS